MRGVTLTELLVTLAILVILVGLAAPQLSTFIAQRAVESQAQTLSAALQLARSEALKRGQPITICKSTTVNTATPSCATTGTDWSSGWLIFADKTAPVGDFDPGDVVLQVQQPMKSGGIVNSNPNAISFSPTGMIMGISASFRVQPNVTGAQVDSPELNRCVVLTVQGRMRTSKRNVTNSNADC